ncbi:glutamate-5-semialdehyde dehydrogenase [Pelolinea submarina]|uniref:Gamma-glutamyl phosphate reductase n=1 Tax=Pelolinea submarina TaxID=913107 RepID=A0A347ZRC0_9CHLR|nr:glutamate-5-semialdehyde dehydrogenase [Pelolinea submarina]REG11593.1 glutamate-5-semialdehyde dehydrogenase [Pelolinea submarina]BBB47851.1 glutamate-5-semialdehyde dehydrogenase [Pelolinea submarina]
MDIKQICQDAKQASRGLALLPAEQKNRALENLADWLVSHIDPITTANQQDVADGREAGLTDALIDRLTLTPARIEGMAADLRHVISLSDPVGEVFEEETLENGLSLRKQRIPLGVLAVIYESRPNVTVDVAALALKSGNAVILRGGSETIRSNRVLVGGIHQALEAAGISPDVVQFIDDPDRALVNQLLKMHDFVDMLIPRGGVGLHRFCRENSSIPVITGGIGICHLFVDESANLEKSLPLIRNAKIQRPTVCNSLDTVLVHRKLAADFIPRLVDYLKKDGVTFRVDADFLKDSNLANDDSVQAARPDDFDTEWLSLVLGIKVVDGLEAALVHIAAHSTGHSDGILTENAEHAARFTNEVDSAAVYVNASTRFTDGSQFGLGAEVAISTQRLHARGPMALRELTTYKWVAQGDYLVRK